MEIVRDENSRNIALVSEYDGTCFLGWQSQQNNRTVQEAIQNAIYDITSQKVILYGCSRTDSGVHATGHVSNFFSTTTIPMAKLSLALNSALPPEISIRNAAYVKDDFNARFDAIAKQYRYRICNEATRPALERLRSYHVPGKLDIERMRLAAQEITGEHDFTSFMASNSSAKTTVRKLYSVDIVENGPIIDIIIKGNGFLYNMVRIISGTLCYVGLGKISPEDIKPIILAKDRKMAGKTLPAHGLCLEKVFYEQEKLIIQ